MHNWWEIKIAASRRKILIVNLLFMIFCSGLAKIWINKYRIHKCHCDTPVCMIIFNCLYATIYIMNYFILSPRGRAVWLTHFPGEGGGINVLESCFFKVPGCPGGVPPGQAVDMCINAVCSGDSLWRGLLKATKKVRQPMTIDDEPEDEQNETLVNSLLAKISLSRRSDNRHFANRICNECLWVMRYCPGSL